MRKFYYFIFLFIYFTQILYADVHQNKSQINFTENEKNFIENHNTVSVAMLQRFKPFSYIENDIHKGMTKDILDIISKKSGLNFDIQLDNWSTNIKKFKTLKVDMITGISYKQSRTSFTSFTNPYYEIGVYLFKNKKNKDINNFANLKGKRVGINKGIFYKQQIEKFGAKVVEYDNIDDRSHALAFGDIDCFLASFTSGINSIETLAITNIKPAFEVHEIKKEDLRFGINKTKPILQSIISKTLKTISSKTFHELKEKWIIHLPSLKNSRLDLTLDELKWIKAHKTIKVHNEQGWIPFNFYEKEPLGFSIDYMNLLAQKIGIKVEYVSGPSWSDFLDMMKTKELDVMLNIVQTNQREKYLKFTKPYKISRDRIYSNNYNKFSSLEELNGKTIAIEKGFSSEEYLKKYYPQIKIKYYKNIQHRLKAVSFGEADATIATPEVAEYMLKKHIITNVVATAEVDFHNKSLNILKLRIATHKNNTILYRLLNKAIKKVSYRENERLNKRWFNNDLTQIEQKITKEEKNYIKNNNFNIVTTSSWSPFNFQNKNKILVGIGVDYLDIIKKKLSLNSTISIQKTFTDVISSIKNSDGDITFTTTDTAGRDQFALFSIPYEKFPIAIASTNEKKFIPNASLLEGKKIAVGKGYSAYYLLKDKYPHINFIFTEDTKEALELVKKHEVYAAIDILPALQFNINNYFEDDLKISGTTDIFFEIKFMVKKEHTLLLSAINKAIESINNDEKNMIYRKWLLAPKNGIDPKLFYNILSVIGLVFAISLFWSFYILRSKRLLEKEKIKLKKVQKELQNLNFTLEDRVKCEVKKNEEQQLLMFHQSRHAQMGEMISMIAHQWRQPINTLSLILQNILFKYERDKLSEEKLNELVAKGNQQIDNMSNTIDDFRNFFKPEKETKEFYINDELNHVYNIIDPILKKLKINVLFDMEDDILLEGYPNEFAQALINIINNAKDALIENKIDKKFITIKLTKIDDKIILYIQDNAGGIPKNIIENIYKPYFSTKSSKIGTGLGLYMSKMIIEDHMNGNISIQNIDDGARFTISFKI